MRIVPVVLGVLLCIVCSVSADGSTSGVNYFMDVDFAGVAAQEGAPTNQRTSDVVRVIHPVFALSLPSVVSAWETIKHFALQTSKAHDGTTPKLPTPTEDEMFINDLDIFGTCLCR